MLDLRQFRPEFVFARYHQKVWLHGAHTDSENVDPDYLGWSRSDGLRPNRVRQNGGILVADDPHSND